MKIETSVVLQQAPKAEAAVSSESDKRIIRDGGCLYPNPGKDVIDPTGGKSFGVVQSGELVKASGNVSVSKDAKQMENQILLGRMSETTCGGMLKGSIVLDNSAPQRVGVIPNKGTLIPNKPVEGPMNQTKIAMDKSTGMSEADKRIIERGGCLYPRPMIDLNPTAPQKPVAKVFEPKTVIAIDNPTGLNAGDRRIIEQGGCLLPVGPRFDLTIPKVDGGTNPGQKASTVGASDVAVEGNRNAGNGPAFAAAAIPLAAVDLYHSKVSILENTKLWQEIIEQRLRELGHYGRQVPRWIRNGQYMRNGGQNFMGHARQILDKLITAENELTQVLENHLKPRPGQKVDFKRIDQLRRLVGLYGASLDRIANAVIQQTGLISAEQARAIREANRAARAAINAGRTAEEGLKAYQAAQEVRAAGIAAGEAELARGAAAAESVAASASRLRIVLRGLGGFVLWYAASEAAIRGSEAMKEAAKIELDAQERMYAQSVINEALQDKIVQPFEIEQMSYAEALVYISGVRQALVEYEIQQKDASENVETPPTEEGTEKR